MLIENGLDFIITLLNKVNQHLILPSVRSAIVRMLAKLGYMLSREKFKEIVGGNVKKIRTKKGLSQDELAHQCGFYRTYINLLETGKRLPSAYSLYRLAKGLHIPVDELYPSIV